MDIAPATKEHNNFVLSAAHGGISKRVLIAKRSYNASKQPQHMELDSQFICPKHKRLH